MSYELQKDLYFFEWDRRHQLFAAIRLPQAVMLGVGGALLFVVRDLSLPMLQSYPFLCFFLGLSVVAYLVNLVLYATVFVGQTYKIVGDSLEMYQTHEAWRAYHQAIADAQEADDDAPSKSAWNDLTDREKSRYADPKVKDIDALALEDFYRDIALNLAEATAWNQRVNNVCWNRLSWGNTILLPNSSLAMAIIAVHYFFSVR
ncbi:MAG: hypothetical protein HQL90_09160 [Magnetococcales bacterium]|nr:hypothetical protein [Magnetococcales bacterium]